MKKIVIQNEGDIKAMLLYAAGKLNVSEKLLPVLLAELQISPKAEGGFEVTMQAVAEDAADPIAAFIKTTLESVGFKKQEAKAADGNADDKKDGDGKGGKTEDEPPVKNPWKRESWNLTEQFRLAAETPTLAEKLKAEAGMNAPEPRRFVRGFEI
jgi:hypothetical protein